MINLNLADKYLYENLRNLANTGYRDDNPRAKYEDDQPAYTISSRGSVFERYDISKGELPISEARPIPWKSSINEILAIYQTQTNTEEGFNFHKCYWWKDWMNEDNNIGRSYAYNLESHRSNEMEREVIKVNKKTVMDEFKNIKEIPLQNEIMKSLDDNIYENHGNPFILIDNRFKITDNGSYIYKIQFLKSGYIKEIRGNDLHQSIKKNRLIKDPFNRSYYGIGYLGDYKKINNINKEILNILIVKWESMIKRCYGTNQNSKIYKDKGIFVHQDWHCFANFLRDVKQIPHFFLAKEEKFKGWELDKDYYSSNCYSLETCTFLKSQENTLYANMRPLKVKNKITGEIKLFLELEKCSKYFNFSKSGLKTALYRPERLTRGNYSNYEFEFMDDNIYRYELSRNQINYLLENLQKDPFSKRHMTSFYSWPNQDKKMLVECAFMTQWTVCKVGEDLYLDLTLIQRSSDLMLAGSGINQIQYVALQMMVAKHCGYKVGLFEHVRKNVHIYDRHLDNYAETENRLKQLNDRKEQSKIELKLNVPDRTNFYNITIDDFELIGYNPIKPQLKFELGI